MEPGAEANSRRFVSGLVVLVVGVMTFAYSTERGAAQAVDVCVFGVGNEPASTSNPTPIVGSPFSDQIWGTSGDDVIFALDGNDVVKGLDGNDTICAGSGNDGVHGGPGNDTIYAGVGEDLLVGGSGHDDLNGGPEMDGLFGSGGADALYGMEDGLDAIDGEPDYLAGGDGTDTAQPSTGDAFFQEIQDYQTCYDIAFAFIGIYHRQRLAPKGCVKLVGEKVPRRSETGAEQSEDALDLYEQAEEELELLTSVPCQGIGDGDRVFDVKGVAEPLDVSRVTNNPTPEGIASEVVNVLATAGKRFHVEYTPRDKENYIGKVPSLQDEITMWGMSVFDLKHEWLELHPVFKVSFNGSAFSGPMHAGLPWSKCPNSEGQGLVINTDGGKRYMYCWKETGAACEHWWSGNPENYFK